MALRLRTPLCDRLGIDVPIVQAPIGTLAVPPLAAAVSNAGGLGMLGVSWLALDMMREFIRETRRLTARPFGVNLALAWDQRERLAICLEEGTPIVALFWGDPTPYVPTIRAAGATLVQTVGSAAEARRAVAAGADVVVAQGWEAGGHVWGEVATMPLVPCVVDAVHPVPVIAAGGLGDGRGVAAALMLGAAGAWLGTRFLASEEVFIHPDYRERVLRASETDTCHTTLFDVGWEDAPHRTLRNTTVEAWEVAGRPRSGRRPGEGETIAALPDGTPVPRYSEIPPLPGMTGDLAALVHYAGQSAGLVRRVQPAAQIVRDLVEEAGRALSAGAELVA
jgi:nitronate monooxygenase